MKIADITFHGAHNYGSVLQAYALQTFVQKLCTENGVECEYKVINFRSWFQKELYGDLPPRSFRDKAWKILSLPYRDKLKKRRNKFCSFVSEHLNLTEEINEVSTTAQVSNRFDVLISGSDQIWNIRARDFSFAYLFEHVDKKKISYAVSLGPKDIDWMHYDRDRYVAALKEYMYVSVREERSKRMVDELLGSTDSEIHVDPTLLLPVEEWRKIQSDYNYNEGQYILFYCLEPNRTHLRIADEFSKKLGLPVVITGYRNKKDYLNHFVKCYDAGPLDFLSLVDHAAFVVTASFHGTVFSLIYNKSFCSINGMKDNRISNILKLAGMENCAVDAETDIASLEIPQINTVALRQHLERERQRSTEYMRKALGL